MANSPEHRTIVQCTPKLIIALQDDLNVLSGELLAAGLINGNNAAALAIPSIGVAERAAQLIGFVRNKVELEAENYHSFIQVLKQRQDDHKNILKILDDRYKDLSGEYY